MRVRAIILQTIVAMIIVAGFSTACSGGGTAGTGGTLRFLGGVTSRTTGDAVPNLGVTLNETGDMAVTDQDGMFTIETGRLAGSVTLRFMDDDIDDDAIVDNIPATASVITVTFEVDDDDQTVETSSVEVTEDDTDDDDDGDSEQGGGGDSDDGDGDSDENEAGDD